MPTCGPSLRCPPVPPVPPGAPGAPGAPFLHQKGGAGWVPKMGVGCCTRGSHPLTCCSFFWAPSPSTIWCRERGPKQVEKVGEEKTGLRTLSLHLHPKWEQMARGRDP